MPDTSATLPGAPVEPQAPAPEGISSDTRLRASMMAAQKTAPDTAARDYELMQKYSLPLDTVQRQRDTIEQRDTANKYDFKDLREQTPVLAAQMEDPAKAGVLKDDIDKMSTLEKVVSNTTAGWNQGLASDRLGEIGTKAALLGDHALSADEWLYMKRQQNTGMDNDLNFWERVPGDVAQGVGQLGSTLADAAKVAVPAAAVGAGVGFAMAPEGGPAAAAVGALRYGGLAMKGSLAAQAFEGEFGTSYLQFRDVADAEGTKIEDDVAKGAAASYATLATLFEYKGMKAVLGGVPGVSALVDEVGHKEVKQQILKLLKDKEIQPILAHIGRQFVHGGGMEGGTEAIQQMFQSVAGELMKSFSNGTYLDGLRGDESQQASWFRDALLQVGQSLEVGALSGSAISGTGRASEIARVARSGEKAPKTTFEQGASDLKNSASAQPQNGPTPSQRAHTVMDDVAAQNAGARAAQESLKQAIDATRETATHKRSPAVMESFLQAAMAKGSDLYLNGAALKTHFQGNDDAYEEFLKRVPEARSQMDSAAAGDADVVVPAWRLTQAIASNPEYEPLVGLVKGSSEQLTDDEAKDAQVDVLKAWPDLWEDVDRESGVADPARDALEHRIATELQAASAGTAQPLNRSQAAASARLVGESHGALLEEAGDDTKAQDIIRRNLEGISVQAGDQVNGSAAQRGNKLFALRARNYFRRQQNANAERAADKDMLGGTRKKRENTGPKPVIDFLTAKGGVQRGTPLAKELEAAGLGPKVYPRLYTATGGLRGFDNIPVEEFNKAMGDTQIVAEDDGNGYVDQQWLMDQLRGESFGKGARSAQQQEDEQEQRYFEELRGHLGGRGIEITEASLADIVQAMETAGPDGQTYNQSGQIVTDTPAFKAWFGDSKVVDADGKPLVVYHGSPDKDIDAFTIGKGGAYFTSSKKLAEGYTMRRVPWLAPSPDGTVYPTYLSLKNPLVIDALGKRHDNIPVPWQQWKQKVFGALPSGAVSVEKAAAYAKEKGYDGLIVKNVVDTPTMTETAKTDVYVAFNPEQIKSIHNTGAFNPADSRILFQGTEGKGPRASVSTTPSGRSIMQLFRGANRSSFLHEMGHVFLRTLRELGTDTDVPRFKDDWAKVQGWWRDNSKALYKEAKRTNPYRVVPMGAGYAVVHNGNLTGTLHDTKTAANALAATRHAEDLSELEARGGQAYVDSFLNSDFTGADAVDQMVLTAMDEQFARGFEQYLMEGKAPSAELVPVFRRFKTWLVKLYNVAQSLDVHVNEDIRGVFSRLLATDAAIDAQAIANPLFRPDPAVMDMLDEAKRRRYMKKKNEQIQAAKEKTFRKIMRAADRETRQWWKEESDRVRKEVAATLPLPAKAAYFLQQGKTVDGSALAPFKLNAAEVKEQWPNLVLPPNVTSRTGMGLDEAAVALGFDGADRMMPALTGQREVAAQIDAEVQRIMLERHGDVLGQIDEIAVNALLGDEALELAQMELEAVPASARGPEFAYGRDFKRGAQVALATLDVRVATKPTRYFQAAIRNARKAGAALARGNFEEFAAAKRREIFAIQMYRQSQAFKDEVAKNEDKFAQILKRPKKGKIVIEPAYQKQAAAILGQVGLAPEAGGMTPGALVAWMTQRQGDDMADFSDWQVLQEIEGGASTLVLDPVLASALGKTDARTMTVEEYRALSNAIFNIAQAGRDVREFKMGEDKRNFDDVRMQIQANLAANVLEKTSIDIKQSSIERVFSEYAASQIKAQATFEVADGGDPLGITQQALMRPIQDAHGREMLRSQQAFVALQKIFSSHYTKNELRHMTGFGVQKAGVDFAINKLYVPAVNQRMSHEERLMVLLNWGNDGNREALMAGFGWTEQQVQAVLDTLGPNDYAAAQDIWDYIDSYWPEIAAREEQRKGYAPKKIEAVPVYSGFKRTDETDDGTLAVAPDGEVRPFTFDKKYRGGYFPIVFDPSSLRTQQFDLQKEMKGAVGAYSTDARANFTNARKGPNTLDPIKLNLSLSVVTGHLQDAIHFLEMGNEIQQVGRMLRDSRVKKEFINRFGNATYMQLDLWLRDTAAGSRPTSDWFSKVSDFARQNAIVATMGLSVSTIISQPSGISQSIVALGGGRTGFKWVGVGYRRQIDMYRNGEDVNAYIAGMSSFMATRSTTMFRELREANEMWAGKGQSARRTVMRALMTPIMWMQRTTVDNATWLGAREKALSEGKSEADAIYLADQTIRQWQGSGSMQDLSGIERGTVNTKTVQNRLYKTLTFAYGYFNTKLNRIYTRTKNMRGKWKDPAEVAAFARDMVFMLWVDAILSDILKNNLPKLWPDDDDDKGWIDIIEGWGWYTASQVLQLFPVVRDAAAMVTTGREPNVPLTNMMKSVYGVGQQIGQGELDKGLLKSLVTATALTTGFVPSVEANRMIDLMGRVHDGDDIEYKDFVRTRRHNEK